jgi:hypothetical protein
MPTRKIPTMHMKIYLLLFISCLIAPDAAAQEIDRRACQQLVRHTPNADVTYQPGIDVHGRPVAPADLSGTNVLQLQDSFEIPLTVNLANRLRLQHNKLGENSDIQIGTLTVKGQQIFYNGQPLNDEQQDSLAVLCLKPKN